MGPFPSSHGDLYILLVVDYVSKWVEAIATPRNHAQTVLKFMHKHIFTRFVVPRVIISDEGTHFDNKLIAKAAWMTKGMPQHGGNGSCPGRYLGGYFRIRQNVILCYWLIPKSCNCLSSLYTISLSGKAITFLLPLSQGYLPCKTNYCCIFLAAETLLLPIPRRSLPRQVIDLLSWRVNFAALAWRKIFGLGWKSSASAGKSALAGNMPDSAQICRGRFSNSAPADAIVAALAGSECHHPGTASVQLPIWH
ncbi:hypothetical protein V6N11_080384 [Hibiscus sabdariffa]|uniref:Integrase catalytic domain-containing protein n=1 Tax=Hibiscus sabdariffa TaxID=183260 RepID=A0ABR2R7H4_9ROSI